MTERGMVTAALNRRIVGWNFKKERIGSPGLGSEMSFRKRSKPKGSLNTLPQEVTTASAKVFSAASANIRQASASSWNRGASSHDSRSNSGETSGSSATRAGHEPASGTLLIGSEIEEVGGDALLHGAKRVDRGLLKSVIEPS